MDWTYVLVNGIKNFLKGNKEESSNNESYHILQKGSSINRKYNVCCQIKWMDEQNYLGNI